MHFLSRIWTAFSEEGDGPSVSWRDVFDWFFIGSLLLVFYYWARPAWFSRSDLRVWLTDAMPESLAQDYASMLPFAWWATTSLVLRIGLPLLAIVFIHRAHPRDYGFRLRPLEDHRAIYAAFFAVMLPLVFAVSFLAGFQKKYPFYDDAGRGLAWFIPYEVLYGIQFLGVEAFFRGYILFALYRKLGNHAVGAMMIPYMMIHFGKPPLETIGAMFAGVALGYLSIRSGSWLYGALLHWSVAITMDVTALWQKGIL